ncbi:hypothetical protein [Thermomonas sp.]|jgi:hypothetical protein|uniref:hypothetical protein n=1 Tax=Thermomonas sp. TaxID=1971895 RepID=UPI00257CFB00|nr:hypothetical protein [Thermomonas sp.]
MFGKPKPSSFKKTYVRILLHGPSGPDDYPLAIELIESDYARGYAIVSNKRETHGSIEELNWGGITTKGRVFADDLQQQIDAASLSSKLIKAALVVFSFLAGALVQFYAALLGRA